MERQVPHRVTQPTNRQSERSSTHEEENQSDAEGTASQFKSQENATTSPKLLQKMKPTQTSDQKGRKLQMQNQLGVLLPLVNEADTYLSNLTTIGKIEGKPVGVMVDTVARVSAIKGKFLKEIYGDVPFSAFQTGKDSLQLRRITYTLPLYL